MTAPRARFGAVALACAIVATACLPGIVVVDGAGADAPITLFDAANPETGHVLRLSWVNPASADFSGVRILRREGGACPTSALDEQAVTVGEFTGAAHDDGGLTNGTEYCYAAFALYAGGARLSAPVVAEGTPTDTVAPAPVTELSAVVDPSGDVVSLSWTLSEPGLESVIIARQLDVAPPNEDVGFLVELGGAATEYDDAGSFADGDHVFYAVFVRDDAGNGSDGAVVDVVVADTTPPEVADAVNFAGFATGHASAALGIVPSPPPGPGDTEAGAILARGPAGGACPSAPDDAGAVVVLDIPLATPAAQRPARVDDGGLLANTAYCYGFWLEDASGNRSPTTTLPLRTSRGPLSTSVFRGMGTGPADSAVVTDVAAFADGSVVVAGVYSGVLTFDPGAADDLSSGGGSEVFVARIGADGSVQWPLSTGGLVAPGAASIDVVDGAGELIVLGFDETMPANTPVSVGALQISPLRHRAFIATIDAAGTPIDGGAVQAGASTDVRVVRQGIVEPGAMLLSLFNGAGGFLVPVTFTSALGVTWSADGPDGSAFALVLSLASDLSLSWSAFADGARVPFGVTGDDGSGNVKLAASWNGNPSLRDGTGAPAALTAPNAATVIVSLHDNGAFDVASQAFTGPMGFADAALGVVDGDVILAFDATAPAGNALTFPGTPANISLTQRGAADAYVARVDVDTGRAIWVTQLGDTGGVGAFVTPGAAVARPRAVAVDAASGVVVVAGELDGSAFAGPAGSAALLEVAGASRTAFIMGLDVDDGAVRWLTQVAGSAGAQNAARAVAFANGDVVVGGALGPDGSFGGIDVVDRAFLLRFTD